MNLKYLIFQFLAADLTYGARANAYKYGIYALLSVVFILFLVIFWYRQKIKKLEAMLKPKTPEKEKPKMPVPEIKKAEPPKPKPLPEPKVKPKDLLDPGLVFKYPLGRQHGNERLITIGQTEGDIKTYSTEVINNHLSVFIRIIENRRDQNIYDLPDKIIEEYLVELRRDGKALIYFEGIEKFREMGARERIYIRKEKDPAGDPNLEEIPSKNPIRIRIGDRLNQDGKFVNGFFEFHLITQDYTVKTKAGIPKVEKMFYLRHFKVYPGYDTGRVTKDGLYPMIDPFTSG